MLTGRSAVDIANLIFRKSGKHAPNDPSLPPKWL